MPRGLYRFHHSGTSHFITFTCYRRYSYLADPAIRDLFVQALERTRSLYRMNIYGFVVMPEHVHLLISEPERGTVASAAAPEPRTYQNRGLRRLATIKPIATSNPKEEQIKPPREPVDASVATARRKSATVVKF